MVHYEPRHLDLHCLRFDKIHYWLFNYIIHIIYHTQDWNRDEPPEQDGEGFYNTSLPVIIFQMIEQNVSWHSYPFLPGLYKGTRRAIALSPASALSKCWNFHIKVFYVMGKALMASYPVQGHVLFSFENLSYLKFLCSLVTLGS